MPALVQISEIVAAFSLTDLLDIYIFAPNLLFLK